LLPAIPQPLACRDFADARAGLLALVPMLLVGIATVVC